MNLLERLEALTRQYVGGDFSNPQWDPHAFQRKKAIYYAEFYFKVLDLINEAKQHLTGKQVRISKPSLIVRYGQVGRVVKTVRPQTTYYVQFEDGVEQAFFDGEFEVVE